MASYLLLSLLALSCLLLPSPQWTSAAVQDDRSNDDSSDSSEGYELDPAAVDEENDEQLSHYHRGYLRKYKHAYGHKTDEQKARVKQNLKAFVKAFKRAIENGWWISESEISGLSEEECRQRTGFDGSVPANWIKKDPETDLGAHPRYKRGGNGGQPSSYDLRGTGYVTSVKNQLSGCGTCYAFAAAAGLEGQYFRKFGNVSGTLYPAVDLSPEQFIDCTATPALPGPSMALNNGIVNGASWRVYEYLLKTGSKAMRNWWYQYDPLDTCQILAHNNLSYLDQEKQFQSIVNPTCGYNGTYPPWGYLTSSYGNGTDGNGTLFLAQSESALQTALLNYGPIVITYNVQWPEFYNYYNGTLVIPNCNHTVNHEMVIVGYNNNANPKDWIAKNSWGSTWGAYGGYIYLKKGDAGMPYGQCGVAYIPHYPDVLAP